MWPLGACAAAGRIIAIPVRIVHSRFVTRIGGMGIDMEASARKVIDALHRQNVGRSITG